MLTSPSGDPMSALKLSVAAIVASGLLSVSTCCAAPPRGAARAFLEPKPLPGQTLSFITYRVISIYGPGIEDSVVSIPATGTYTFEPSVSADIIHWKADVRMDGKRVIKDLDGEYRDQGTSICYSGKCSFNSNASGPFYNPTFWGTPDGKLKAGQTWNVTLAKPWELGPAGSQTVTVLSVDKANGIVVLKREGEGVGSYEGSHDIATVRKNGKVYTTKATFGKAHWIGQAVIQHGVIVSDELLCTTPVELSSPDFGTSQAEERQYMSLLEHPAPIGS